MSTQRSYVKTRGDDARLGFALVLAAVLLAGCGRGKKAAKPNGEASKPPTPGARRRAERRYPG